MPSSHQASRTELASAQSKLQPEVEALGRVIFSEIKQQSPSIFNTQFWSGMLMEWSMKRPELKSNLFRLVDVLPALQSSASIADHLEEYLGSAGSELPLPLRYGLRLRPRAVRDPLAAFAVRFGVKQMAKQFIAGETPEESLAVLRKIRAKRLAFTVDLLGEYCVSRGEAEHYLQRYLDALECYGKSIKEWPEAKPIIKEHPGERSPICVSVKLSALYARCEPLNFERSVAVLSDKLIRIVRKAKAVGAQVYVDSEDTANNPIILETFFRVFGSKEFSDFPYPGMVLQAYAKDSDETFERLLNFTKDRGAPVAVRLVKGAYWDAETIVSDQNHWESPLFAQKQSSDAQFELLSMRLLDNTKHFLPAFGSHNVRSLSFACAYAAEKGVAKDQFEIQALFGMAEPIARAYEQQGHLVRLYVPLGEMIPGMGYLIRRLLENTSNESFLRHTFFDEQSIDALLRAPAFKG